MEGSIELDDFLSDFVWLTLDDNRVDEIDLVELFDILFQVLFLAE